MTSPKTLPLHVLHEKLGAKLGCFGNWEVPLYYSSIVEEHLAVRERAGIFDISHMGEFLVRGNRARQALNEWLTNRVSKLQPGKAIYSPLCNPSGGIVDDVVLYQLEEESFLMVVNAANIEKDFNWLSANLHHPVELSNVSEHYGLLSIQGPRSQEILTELFSSSVKQLSYYSVMRVKGRWRNALLARTGYTGELGYELFVSQEHLEEAYHSILDCGGRFGVQPAGFGARDTLRLEACMLLYGQDMNDNTTPLEAGIGWTVAFEKNFIGREALEKQQAAGIPKKLVAFEMLDRGVARHGYPIAFDGKNVGEVTSGSFSPTLQKNIGLAYVPVSLARVGREFEVSIRGRLLRASIVKKPFYTRHGHKL